jgi:PAS domain S-box-containing protein
MSIAIVSVVLLMNGRNAGNIGDFSLDGLTAQPQGRQGDTARAQLSPDIAYYLHKLLRRNLDRLLPLKEMDPAMAFDTLDALDMLLHQVYDDDTARQTAARILEQIVPSHQTLNQQRSRYYQELRRTENQIFALLGFQLQAITDQITILVIDDTKEQFTALHEILTQGGYEVCHATSDRLEIALIQEICPELIILGPVGKRSREVCQRLQSIFLTRHLPVVFIDLKANGHSTLNGFDLGCVDSIPQPFQAEEVLTRVGNHLHLRSLQKRLESQNVQLRRESHDRRTAEFRYHQLIERSADGIFQSTHAGRFLRANHALAAILGYASPKDLVAQVTNISQHLYVRPHRRSQWLETLRQHGQVENMESEVFRQDGSTLWIAESAYAVQDSHGNTLFYEGVVRDISDRKQATTAQSRIAHYLDLQCAITRVLSGSEYDLDAQHTLLEFIGHGLDWQLGELWMVDKGSNVLRCADSWHDGSLEVQEFQAITQNLSFAPGVGLPGRIWLSSDTIWIENMFQSTDFLRGPAMCKSGLHSAFGVPILSQGHVLGVMTFFHRQVQTMDPALMMMMKAVGQQIGQFLERKRLEVCLKQTKRVQTGFS